MKHQKHSQHRVRTVPISQLPIPQIPSSNNDLTKEAHPGLPLCTPVSSHLRIRFSFDRLRELAVQAKTTLWRWIQHKPYVTNLSANRGTERHWQMPASTKKQSRTKGYRKQGTEIGLKCSCLSKLLTDQCSYIWSISKWTWIRLNSILAGTLWTNIHSRVFNWNYIVCSSSQTRMYITLFINNIYCPWDLQMMIEKFPPFFFLLNKTGNFYLEWLEIPSGHKESRNLPVSLNAEDILVNTCWEKGIIISLVPIADYLCTACVLYQGLKRNKNICLNEFVNVTAPGKRFHNWGWGQNSMTMWWREYASSWYDSRVPWL